MKTLLLTLLTLLFYSSAFSQDIIERKNGQIFDCEITKQDSINVYFKLIKGQNEINTLLPLSEVKNIIRKEAKENEITQNPEEIFIRKSNGYKYYTNNKTLKPVEVVGLLSLNPNAYKIYKSAKGKSNFAAVLGGSGGFLVGWTIGTELGGGEANYILAGVGAGLIAISIPISIGSRKEFHKAIETYNAGLNKTSYKNIKLNFGTTQNGVGLCLNF